MRKVHLELLYLLPVTKSRTHTYGISVCKTSWNGSPSSPLIAPGTPIWCLFRTRRSSCPRWGGCPSWSGLWVSRAGGLSQRSKGLRVEGCERSDLTGLMSAHKFQYKLLLQQDFFLRYEDCWQHQSTSITLSTSTKKAGILISQHVVKECQREILSWTTTAVANTPYKAFRQKKHRGVLLSLSCSGSPTVSTNSRFIFTILTCSAAFPTAAPLIEGPEFWKMTKEENKLTCRNKSRLSTVSSRLVSTFYITRDYGQEA